jgi:hypothetical protein
MSALTAALKIELAAYRRLTKYSNCFRFALDLVLFRLNRQVGLLTTRSCILIAYHALP